MSIGKGAGLPVTALLTDMNEVLGVTVGHALEIEEAVTYLTGGPRDPRLHEVTIALAAEMLLLGKLVDSLEEGRARAQGALDSGRAAEIFAAMVTALGGPKDFLEKSPSYLEKAPLVKACPAARSGTLAAMDARAVGVAAIGLGGGRRTTGDVIDLAVGFSNFLPLGSKLEAGQAIALVHARSGAAADAAIAELQQAMEIHDAAPAPRKLVSARITSD